MQMLARIKRSKWGWGGGGGGAETINNAFQPPFAPLNHAKTFLAFKSDTTGCNESR